MYNTMFARASNVPFESEDNANLQRTMHCTNLSQGGTNPLKTVSPCIVKRFNTLLKNCRLNGFAKLLYVNQYKYVKCVGTSMSSAHIS